MIYMYVVRFYTQPACVFLILIFTDLFLAMAARATLTDTHMLVHYACFLAVLSGRFL